ncbi:MAG: HK97 family phage prohead protease [Nitrospinales bacterium]
MEKSAEKRKTAKETRVFSFEKLNVEERADGMGPKITGYAAVFDKWSEDLGGFKERIQSGAFKKAIGKSDVRGLFNHDSNFVLGRQSNGTLTIKEDKNGLWMEIDPPDTQIIRDLVLAPIKRGDITQQSFGFIVGDDKWDNLNGEKKDHPATRTILEVDELFDVSPVTFPAYPDTSVALRSMDKAKETVFKPASEEDILNLSLRDFLNAEQPEETREAAEKMVDILMPKLSDEQREKYTIVKEISAAKPDGEPPAAAVDIEDDSSDDGRARKAENRWLKLDKKIARILRG